MRKNKNNFPVLQQDIHPNSRPRGQENIIPKKKNQKDTGATIEENQNFNHSNDNNNQVDDIGVFFDEVNLREENKLNGENAKAEEQKKKKEKRKLLTFKPDILLDKSKGLKVLYTNIEKFKLLMPENSENFDEFKQLHKLMRLIKEWHFLCMPKYDFDYFLNRCQDFGNKPIIKSHLTRMRKIHKGIMRWEDIENEDENNQTNSNGQTFMPVISNDNNEAANHNENAPNITNTSSNNTKSQNQNNNGQQFEDGFEEIMEQEDAPEEIPAEIMNAPDFGVGLDFEEEDEDLETYEVQRNLKKIKPENL